jgi:hypothetical protein
MIREASSVDGTNELMQLVQQATTNMAADYKRIRMRAQEDPGTAGDQGEENWAELLRGWLPATFYIVTKGRIVFSGGQASRQLDVLVLSPSYPKGLLNNKLYLAAGVLAAFECKITLRRKHIIKAVKSGDMLGSISRTDRSVKQHIVDGLLAHSHDIASKNKPPQEVIMDALIQAEPELNDPRDCLDFICVADLGTWALMRLPVAPASESSIAAVVTSYMGPLAEATHQAPIPHVYPDPIGRFLTGLLRRLGPIDPAIASIATYFHDAGLLGSAKVRQGNGNLPRLLRIYSS